MEPTMQQPMSSMPSMPQPPVSGMGETSSKKYLWIALLAIVILVAAYFWYSGTSPLYKSEETATEEVVAPAADDVTSIEADLGTTDLDSLGADLDSLEKELAQ